jgi:hypothetical protein
VGVDAGDGLRDPTRPVLHDDKQSGGRRLLHPDGAGLLEAADGGDAVSVVGMGAEVELVTPSEAGYEGGAGRGSWRPWWRRLRLRWREDRRR